MQVSRDGEVCDVDQVEGPPGFLGVVQVPGEGATLADGARDRRSGGDARRQALDLGRQVEADRLGSLHDGESPALGREQPRRAREQLGVVAAHASHGLAQDDARDEDARCAVHARPSASSPQSCSTAVAQASHVSCFARSGKR